MLELDGVNMTAYLTEKADWHLECAAKGIYYNQCLRAWASPGVPRFHTDAPSPPFPKPALLCCPRVVPALSLCCPCVLAVSAETALILMIVGGILVVGGVTFMFFCCGWCKCCNAEGDDSNWGCCNRIKKSCKKQSAEEIQMMNNPGYRREKEKAEQEKSGLF